MSASQIHDFIFSAGGVVFVFALLPAVLRKSILPLSTALVTMSVCFVFALNYAWMGYWYAFVLESCLFLLWAYLAAVALKAREKQSDAPESLRSFSTQ
jgi:hypothetical protein